MVNIIFIKTVLIAFSKFNAEDPIVTVIVNTISKHYPTHPLRMVFSLSKYIILIEVPSFYDQKVSVYHLLQGKAVFKCIIFDHVPTRACSIRTIK